MDGIRTGYDIEDPAERARVLKCINDDSGTDAMYTHMSNDPTVEGRLLPEVIVICKSFVNIIRRFGENGGPYGLTQDFANLATDADRFRAIMRQLSPDLLDVNEYVPMDFMSDYLLDHVLFHEVSLPCNLAS